MASAVGFRSTYDAWSRVGVLLEMLADTEPGFLALFEVPRRIMPTRCRSRDQPLSGPRPQLSTTCSQNGRSLQQLKAATEFDGLVEVTTMRNSSFGLRRLLSLIAGLILWAAAARPAAAEPSAAGLWQEIGNGEPRLYRVVVDHNGVFEGVMAKLFPKPGSTRPRICSDRTDDRKNATCPGISFCPALPR